MVENNLVGGAVDAAGETGAGVLFLGMLYVS